MARGASGPRERSFLEGGGRPRVATCREGGGRLFFLSVLVLCFFFVFFLCCDVRSELNLKRFFEANGGAASCRWFRVSSDRTTGRGNLSVCLTSRSSSTRSCRGQMFVLFFYFARKPASPFSASSRFLDRSNENTRAVNENQPIATWRCWFVRSLVI